MLSFFRQQKFDESGQVSTDTVVGKFKGIVEIDSKQEREEYLFDKKLLKDDILRKMQTIAVKTLGSEIDFKPDDLDSALGVKSFELKMRSINCQDLMIGEQLREDFDMLRLKLHN